MAYVSGGRRRPMRNPFRVMQGRPMQGVLGRSGKPSYCDVCHFMAAFVEFLARGLACGRLVKREEEHAPLGAELLLFARRVPTRAEALGRKDDELAASLGDGVSAGLFERAHEGRNARAARPDARGRVDHRQPFGRTFGRRAMAFEGRQDGQVENRAVAVGEPAATEKLDFGHSAEILGVGAALPGACGVFLDVTAKGCKLAGLLDDPIVPVILEYRADETARCGTRGFAGRGFARANHSPISFGKSLLERVDEATQGDSLGYVANLDQQVKMVGHDHEGRDLFTAAPLHVKALDDRFERAGDFVFDEAVGSDLGKCRQPLESFQGHHVVIRRLVVETGETSHIVTYFSKRSS